MTMITRPLRFTVHITFHFVKDRIKFLNLIIAECGIYPGTVDIFIHANAEFSRELLVEHINGKLNIVIHDMTGQDPFLLSWKCRGLMQSLKNEYDVFMYLEDDILVPRAAIDYWLEYAPMAASKNYNLGFVRTEISRRAGGAECITDFPKVRLPRAYVRIQGADFVFNRVNPYCAFWIYDKDTFARWTESPLYKPQNIKEFNIREKSATGLHGPLTRWFDGTVIPVVEGGSKLHPGCKVRHLGNNYTHNLMFCTILFDDAIARLDANEDSFFRA